MSTSPQLYSVDSSRSTAIKDDKKHLKLTNNYGTYDNTPLYENESTSYEGVNNTITNSNRATADSIRSKLTTTGNMNN